MKKNVGSADRLIRIILAVVLAALVLSGALEGTLAVILGIVATVLVLTSLISFCPLYALLGITTLKQGS